MGNNVIRGAATLYRWVPALLLSATAASCAADAEPGAAAGAAATPLRCDHLALADSSAQPLDWVPLEGVPDGYDGTLRAELRTAADTVTSYAFTGSNDAGEHFLLAPLHPRGTIEGGAVQLRFTDGATRCPAVEFTVEPMPPAPGTFDRVVAGVQDYLRVQSAALGTTPAALRAADPDTLLPPLVPLWIAQVVLDHPDNPNSLRHAGGDSMDSHARLVDALLAKSGVLEALPALVDQVDSLQSLPGADPIWLQGAHESAAARSIFSFAAVRPATARPLPSATDAFTMSAGELDQAMSLAMSSDIATSGRAGDIYSAFTGAVSITTLLAKAGGAEPAAGALAWVGGIAFTYQQVALAAAKLLPRRFTDLTFSTNPSVFREDEPGPGGWRDAKVTAVSEGWQADEAILQSLLYAAGTGKAGGITRKTEWLENLPTQHMRDLAYGLRHFVVGDLLGRLIGDAGKGGPMRLGPYTFTADISKAPWREVNYTGGAVQVVLGSDEEQYEPIDVGRSTLTISTPPKKFGFQLIRRDEPIVVEPIRVAFDPPRAIVEPGDRITFKVTVSNALDGHVELEPTAGTLLDQRYSATGLSEHMWSVTLQTPTDEDAFPVRLKATSTADRSHLNTAEERSATARIDLNQLAVLPRTACILPGERQSFTAMLAGKPTTAVRWSASAGEIDRDGEFRDPGGNGTATITAVDRTDPDRKGETTVSFGERCESWYELTTSGDVSLSQEGPMWSVMGIPTGKAGEDLCAVNISVAAPKDSPDQFFTLSAALPNGLQEGRYSIARGYTSIRRGAAGERSSLVVPRGANFEKQRATPGVFYAGSELGSYAHTRLRGENRLTGGGEFTSEFGSVTIRRLGGNRIDIAFQAVLLETGSEGEQLIGEQGTSMSTVYYPLRKIEVEGHISHRLSSSGSVWNSYRCEPLESDPSEADS